MNVAFVLYASVIVDYCLHVLPRMKRTLQETLVTFPRHDHEDVSVFIIPSSHLQELQLVMFWEMKAVSKALYWAHPFP